MRTCLFLFLFVLIASCSFDRYVKTIDLSGEWNFRSDPESLGITHKWYLTAGTETVKLPGSMTKKRQGR